MRFTTIHFTKKYVQIYLLLELQAHFWLASGCKITQGRFQLFAVVWWVFPAQQDNAGGGRLRPTVLSHTATGILSSWDLLKQVFRSS